MSRNKSKSGSEIKLKPGLVEIIIPALALLTIINCIVILVMVVNIGRKVRGLEQKVQTIQGLAYQGALNSGVSGTDNNGGTAETAAGDGFVWEEDEKGSDGIKRVYFTFDDGPSPNTDRILDILNQYGIKATFFVVGKNRYQEQYKRIVEDGHTLGMHSYSHKYDEIYSSLEAYRQDLTQLHDFLYELTGEDCKIVRFPGGSSNTISKVDMWELIDYLDAEGMMYFDWNVASGDASGGGKSAEQIAKNVLDSIDKYNNSVVLFHDAADKTTTVDALPAIIEAILESDNTVILPISADTVKVQHLHK